MSVQAMMDAVMVDTAYLPEIALELTVTELPEGESDEILSFLSERPTHTVCMAGMIRDNGFDRELNRGTFYGCRNSEGRLEGVALIGHATLLETRTRRAVMELALTAQIHNRLHMIMAEQEKVEEFWNHYADQGQPMRFAAREHLFELKTALEVRGNVDGLRLATLADLELIAPIHAAMAEEASGIDPLIVDREGFLKRCSRRITQNRVWVVVEEDKLLFKADVQAQTPEVIYLEGVYSGPMVRGSGIARKCFTKLCELLLKQTRSLCVLTDEDNGRAQAFYRLCGFKRTSNYDTIFLKKNNDLSTVS